MAINGNQFEATRVDAALHIPGRLNRKVEARFTRSRRQSQEAVRGMLAECWRISRPIRISRSELEVCV